MNDEKLNLIARAYYNRGLKMAKERDLSSAVRMLELSLRFDKYLTEARNLLGLIRYERGETGEALSQWIISTNLSGGKNPARRYLDEIDTAPGVLEEERTLIKRFNQALNTAKNGGEDFACIELRDIVRKKPHFIKAGLLLALLSMAKGEYDEARAALNKVLEVDHTHSKAQLYLSFLPKEDEKEAGSPGLSLPTVSPGPYRAKTVLYVFIGLILGLLSFYILILPTVRQGYTETLNESIIRNSDQLSSISSAYSELSSEYDELKSSYDDVSERLNAYEQENLDFTANYELLNGIISDCAEGDYLSAARAYTSINRDNITEEPFTGLLNDADRLMLTDGFDAIEDLGTDAWNGGNKSLSEEYYRLCLEIKSDDPEVMFLLARLLQSEDRIAEANEIFDRIVGEHPESPYAERAVDARGY